MADFTFLQEKINWINRINGKFIYKLGKGSAKYRNSGWYSILYFLEALVERYDKGPKNLEVPSLIRNSAQSQVRPAGAVIYRGSYGGSPLVLISIGLFKSSTAPM